MKNIILTGPKHSGKTSAGKILASLFSCDFIDLDDLILQRTGKTPRQLYSESPSVFQKAEADAMAAIAGIIAGGADDAGIIAGNAAGSGTGSSGAGSGASRIIAAGGGIIDNTKAIDILKNSDSVIVYLNISAAAAWQRISAAGELPPFLKTDNPQETHRALHERRADAYMQLARASARNIIVETEGKTPQEIAGEIKQLSIC